MSPETRLFQAVTEHLKERQIRFLFTRNYEAYPERFTGDVDIYAELGDHPDVLEGLRLAVNAAGWRVVHSVDRPWVIVLQCVPWTAPDEARPMVFEIFDRFTWLGLPYCDFDQVWGRTTLYQGLHVVGATLGTLLTFAHYYFWAGFFPRKYRAHVIEMLGDPRFPELRRIVLPDGLGGRRIEPWLRHYWRLAEGDWSRKPNVPEEIAKIPRRSRAISKFMVLSKVTAEAPLAALFTIKDWARLALGDVLRARGKVMIVGADGWQVIVTAKKYHLYKNRNSMLLKVSRLHSLLLALPAAQLSVGRGGLCVIEVPEEARMLRSILRSVFGERLSEEDTKVPGRDALQMIIDSFNEDHSAART